MQLHDLAPGVLSPLFWGVGCTWLSPLPDVLEVAYHIPSVLLDPGLPPLPSMSLGGILFHMLGNSYKLHKHIMLVTAH